MARSELSGIGMMSIPAQKDTATRDGKDVSYTLSFLCWCTDLLADLSWAAFE